MATISAYDGLTMAERVAKSIDPAAIEAMRRDEAARANAERIQDLRHIVFRNAARGRRNIEDLTNQADAASLLVAVGNQADGFAVLGILRIAIEKRWSQVVKAGIRYFGEHPVAARIQELWDLTLTTDRRAAV